MSEAKSTVAALFSSADPMTETGFLKAVILMRQELNDPIEPLPSRASTANSSRTVTATGFVCSTVNRLWSFEQKRREKSASRKVAQTEEELKTVRDRPLINSASREMAGHVIPIRLRSEAEIRRRERKRGEMRQSVELGRKQEEQRECTFRPCLAKRTPRLRACPSFQPSKVSMSGAGDGEPSFNMESHPTRTRSPGALLYQHSPVRLENGVEVRDIYLYAEKRPLPPLPRPRSSVSCSPTSLEEFETLEALLTESTPN